MSAICVFCASSELVDPRYLRLAAAVGTEIARRGHTLVSGGGSVSAMGALARAARAGGATTVGVIPRALAAAEVADRDADELVVTEDMRSRKAAMDARADAFLVLPGGIGTLEELLEVWVSRTLGLHARPVVVFDDDGVYAPLRTQIELLVERGFVRRSAAGALRWTADVRAALDAVEDGLADRDPAGRTPTSAEVLEAEP